MLAVLTGDLVGSTKANPARVAAIFERLAEADGKISAWPGEESRPRLERFRGDGWQALIARPAHALRAALLFAAAARSAGKDCATRVAVGVGPVTMLDPNSLGASDGAAFRLSGKLLERFPRHGLIAADMSGQGAASPWARSTFAFAGLIAADWTPKQAEVMRALLDLDPPTQAELADRASVTKQTVQGHFESANGPAILEIADRLEADLRS